MSEPVTKVGLVTDSSCDLPQQILDCFSIAIIPLMLHFGTDSYVDGELTTEAFWKRAEEAPTPPQTSQPSVGVFERTFERLVERGKQVLCVTLTGEHTGTIETARLAARRFGDAVRVFDSHSLSLGMGFQVLEAAQASQLGRSMEELLALLEDMRSRTHALVLLDTLESVRRGGRADAFIGMVSRMSRVLNIKPIITFVEGRVQLMSVTRSFRRGVDRLLSIVEDMGPLDHLAVMHARNAEAAERLADRLAERIGFPREEIVVGETGAVVASHAGPGAIGIFAVSRREVEAAEGRAA
jgi:DegV family protein with EDD domain